MKTENKNNMFIYQKLNVYNKKLFATGAAAVVIGLFLPTMTGIIDILLVFSISLCAAVVLISISSKDSSELSGFGALTITSASALLTVNIASSKLILVKITGSNIINFLSSVNLPARVLPIWLTAIIFFVILLAILFMIRKTCRKTIVCSYEFLEEMSAIQSRQIENDYAIIDSGQEDIIARQKGFFFSIAAFAKFSFCIAVTICVVNFFAICASFIVSSLNSSDSSADPTILLSTCGVFILLMVYLSSFAVSRVTIRNCSESIEQTMMTEQQFAERIKVTAREVAASQIIDFDEYNNRINEFELPGDHFKTEQPLFITSDMDNESSYEMLADLILGSNENKCVLMTADGQNNLPCTIPVNTAIKLACGQLKTLIIDFDLERTSVTQVFEIKDCQTKVTKTCIEDLYLFSAIKLARTSAKNLKPIFEKLSKSFENIIIYCPDSSELLRRDHFFEFINSAIVFGDRNTVSEDQKLLEQLSDNNCQILGPQFELV